MESCGCVVVLKGSVRSIEAEGVDCGAQSGSTGRPFCCEIRRGSIIRERGTSEERVIQYCIGFGIMKALLPASPVADASHIQEVGVIYFTKDVAHGMLIPCPVLLKKSGVIGVEMVVVGSDHCPHVVGVGALLRERWA